MVHVCPTDVVRAPMETVWHFIAMPVELARWTDARVIDAPPRELRGGDRLVLGAGIGHRLHVVFRVQDAVRPERLDLQIRLPLGVTNHEVIELAAVGRDACRVTFN